MIFIFTLGDTFGIGFPTSCQKPQLLNFFARDVGWMDQTTSTKLGNPFRIVHVCLLSRKIFNMLRIRQNQRQIAVIKNIKYWNPILPSTFEKNMRYVLRLNPCQCFSKFLCCCTKGTMLFFWCVCI